MKGIIDISGFKEYRGNMALKKPEYNNKFGWDVHTAEVEFDESTKTLNEYRLLSERGDEQCHAKRVDDSEIVYWHFEFRGRGLSWSPDPFEPSIEEFLRYYYTQHNNCPEKFEQELDLPIVFYELFDNEKLHIVRYALAINELYSKPLFVIIINEDGQLEWINDFQTSSMKSIAMPMPDNIQSNNYLIQKFGKLRGCLNLI